MGIDQLNSILNLKNFMHMIEFENYHESLMNSMNDQHVGFISS